MGRKKNNSNMFETFPFGDVEAYSKDKKVIADTNVITILNRMQAAFKWDGLPDTIPQKWLEFMLQTTGWCFITKVNGKLYAFIGGLGGDPDVYYQPTICTVSNPALSYSAELKIGTDGVLISDDVYRTGIIPIIGKYAGLLAENTITIRIADIMSRITSIVSGSDESTIESAKEYFKQLEDGSLGVIEESAFLEDLKVQASATSGATRLTDLIEMEQYLKSSMYNELGLQANYNMKRESINSSEAELGDDVLQPFIDNMLEQRQAACKEINEMFGTNISCELASAWKLNDEEREAELEEEQKGADDGNQNQSNNSNDISDDGGSVNTEE